MALFNKKSKVEKEAEKLAKQQEKAVQKVREEREMRKLDVKQKALKAEAQRIDDITFERKIDAAKAQLIMLHDKFIVKLAMELNNLENIKSTDRKEAVRKSRQRIKNYYYTLVIIYRSRERLNDIESDHEWSNAMGELSNTFKLMNKINSGYEPIKKLLFRIRLKKAETADDIEYSKLTGYYGERISEAVPEYKVEELRNIDPMDMLVSDELFNLFIDDSSDEAIDYNVRNGAAIKEEPSKLMDDIKEADNEAVAQGETSVTSEFTSNGIVPQTEEEIAASFNLT